MPQIFKQITIKNILTEFNTFIPSLPCTLTDELLQSSLQGYKILALQPARLLCTTEFSVSCDSFCLIFQVLYKAVWITQQIGHLKEVTLITHFRDHIKASEELAVRWTLIKELRVQNHRQFCHYKILNRKTSTYYSSKDNRKFYSTTLCRVFWEVTITLPAILKQWCSWHSCELILWLTTFILAIYLLINKGGVLSPTFL